jgi:hypothetical protein
MASRSIGVLIRGLVDYAGLFPPAKLDMAKAVERFAAHRESPHATALARFICPVSRLDEFARHANPLLPSLEALPVGVTVSTKIGPERSTGVVVNPPGANGTAYSPPQPWTLSVLIDGRLDQNLAAIEEFNQSHYRNHHHSAVIDTLEIKIATTEAIEGALDVLPEELYPFFEIPHTADLRSFATALAGTGAGAKLRTGGVTPDLFPAPELVADFLQVMNHAQVPIKCTAGLHHPIRAAHPLTYEPGCATHTMHGFLNVFLAAAFCRGLDIDRATTIHIITDPQPDSFRFSDEGVSWRGLKLSIAQLEDAREEFAICFGSCSFDEPIADLIRLGLLR